MDSNRKDGDFVTKKELADILRFVARLLNDGDLENMGRLKYQMAECGVKAEAVADLIDLAEKLRGMKF